MTKKHSIYRRTTIACFFGIFTQAIITNLTAILFIPMMGLYGFSYGQLGLLVGINFAAQVSADIIFSGLIDKIGFRKITQCTCALSFIGLLLFALTPNLFPSDPFFGFIISTIIFAFSSGLLEVILSPIIDAMPNDDKGPAMSLMHSFYAWGLVATIIITTLFIHLFGGQNWQIIVFAWALIPLTTFLLFLSSPMPPNSDEHTRSRIRDLLVQPFYLFALAAILFGGATEVCMNQWSSTFLNGALHIPKLTGDLLGMCGFAVMLGLGRMLYGIYGSKIDLGKVLLISSGVCVVCYAVAALSPINTLNVLACALTGLFASLLWPGVLVITSERYPLAGASLFAILAAAGDIGAGCAPYITGLITDHTADWSITQRFAELYATDSAGAGMRVAILFSLVFPLIAFLSHMVLRRLRKKALPA